MLPSFEFFVRVDSCNPKNTKRHICGDTGKPKKDQSINAGQVSWVDASIRRTSHIPDMADAGLRFVKNGKRTKTSLIGVTPLVGNWVFKSTELTIQKAMRLKIADGSRAGSTTETDVITSSMKPRWQKSVRHSQLERQGCRWQKSMASITH